MAAPIGLFKDILDLEERTWRALQNRGSDLVPFLSRDCIMMFPMGMKVGPATEPSVQDILHSPAFVPWKTFDLHKVDVQAVGDDGAIISYQAIATRTPAKRDDKEDVEFDALCSSVWRLESGVWKMCLHQQTV